MYPTGVRAIFPFPRCTTSVFFYYYVCFFVTHLQRSIVITVHKPAIYHRTTNRLLPSNRNRTRRQYRFGILKTVIVVVRVVMDKLNRRRAVQQFDHACCNRPQSNSINLCQQRTRLTLAVVVKRYLQGIDFCFVFDSTIPTKRARSQGRRVHDVWTPLTEFF